jgi:DNA polymerase-3 subunit alpha
MVKLAKKRGMPAIGLTDHGNMYGAIEFYKTCKSNDIKPIIGVEVYVTPDSRHEKRPGIDIKRFHLTLLAKNNIGYKNLIKLVTLSNIEGFYYKPRVDKELLKKYSDGLVCLSGCFGGELSRAIHSGDIEKAEKIAKEHEEIYGKGNYFLEIMHHPSVPGIEEVRKEIIKMSKKLDIPLVATQDSHYLNPDDARAHETLLAVQTNSDLRDENRFSMGSEDFSFIDGKTALKYFKDTPEAVENTVKIAEMCDVEIKLGSWVFPDLKIPENTNYDDELKRVVYEGIPKRGLSETKDVVDRIEYELEIIKTKGYSPYFLVVSDLIRFSNENGILTNIRGSVAGSITTYLLGITSIDPLKYKLPFERFLNPERPSAPDIDMDFADNRRDEVIEYARQKYGHDKVAQIGTFGTMMAKGSVRDVARALGHPYSIGDKISSLIPLGSQGFPMTIDKAISIVPELKELYKKDADTKEIIDLAKRLEGCVRHISVHAAGVVISPTSLTDFVPVQLDPKGGKIITQYDMHAVEDAGLLKFDFLGIRNLAILENAAKLTKKIYNTDVIIEEIPVDDKKTFEMLARGETMGLFQLNGGGMTRYLKELKPSSIHDINAMVALYRPGPMESIPEYIKRKYNNKLITYLDPRMKDILDQSYGVLTYQDDVLLISINIAGYSWLEADKLRKAMGKKIPKEMAAQEEKFISGAVDGGLSSEKAMKLWKLIEPFAAYGFNKAHAASYGKVAYQTAYMKANFPTPYMTALLTAESGDTEKISEIISECKRMNIPVLPTDINESFGDFSIVRDDKKNEEKIRFGLYTIKNLGTDIGDAIIEERKENGKFKSISDFLERITHKNLNKKSFEALVKCGAMDKFGERGVMLANMEDALAYNKECKGDNGDQVSLFGEIKEKENILGFRLKDGEPATDTEKLSWEKELLGLYISGHPLDKFKDKFEKRNINIKKIKSQMKEGMITVIAGIIEEAKEVTTKKGDRMAFLKIADFTDNIEVVVFPKLFLESKEILENNKCIALKGKISERNGTVSIIAEGVKELV